jgi:hypothetical protein
MGSAPISRGVAAALGAAAAAFATFASAATLGGLEASALGAGGGPIPRCDSTFDLAPATSGGNVVTVTVGDVADACEGGDLSLTLTGSGGSVVASGGPTAIPVDGDGLPSTVIVSVLPTPPAEQVVSGHVSMVGP